MQNSLTQERQVPEKKHRDSNLELFRILTMLLIIAHHYVVNSGLTNPEGPVFENLLSFDSLFVTIHHKKFTENRHYPLFIEIQM